MDDTRVRQFERELWVGDGTVYRKRIAEDCLMVVPAPPFVLRGIEAIAAVEATPRWSQVDFETFEISRLQECWIVIAYKVTAKRDDETYEAYCTSTLRRQDNDDWVVVQHQQTVAPVR